MPLYLELAVGRFRFLVDAVAVSGVSRESPVAGNGAVDCRALFGLDEPFPAQAVRLGVDGETVRGLLVDSVVATRSFDEGAFQPFPGHGEAARWFDAVAQAEDGVLLPRMKVKGRDR